MKRIVLGSSLLDYKLIKLPNFLCSQMEDIGLAWFGVAWDVGLKVPSLSAWPWTVKIASLLFRFSVIQAHILLSAIPISHCTIWFLCCLANCITFNFSTVVKLCPFVFAAAMIDHKFTMIAIKMLQNSLFSLIFKQLLLVNYAFILSLDNSPLKQSLLFFHACMQMSVALKRSTNWRFQV